jgi:outer membrane protein assembly factor BamB
MTFSRTIRTWIIALFTALLTLGCSRGSASDRPEWRGLMRTGHTDEADLPLTWGGKGAANVLWKVPADFGHSSPVVRGDRILLTGSVRKTPKGKEDRAADQVHRVACYRTTDGTKLWQTDVEPGTWGLAIDPTGEGDVTKTHVRWRHARNQQGFGSPIVVGDYLYRVGQPGVLRCWKWSNGEVVFEEKLEGAPTYPSPVATKDGHIYFASGSKSVVVKAGMKPEVLATNVLEASKGEWTLNGPSPAVSGGRILVRSPKMLYGVGKK